MIERILEIYGRSTYDFRTTAFPGDPLSHLFPAWVSYYRMKAAIAEALQPSSILEIGVRYGYSAAAFLHGAPAANYTGIDADSSAFGGSEGALDWARANLPAARVTLIKGNTQQMPRLPGGVYDLVHIDGQQDGDGTFIDLEKAIGQARYVLVGSYLWSSLNFLATNEFLVTHQHEIEYALVITGYAGELLIKAKHQSEKRASDKAQDSLQIRDSYDREYYLTDCGGWDSFAVSGHNQLEDNRLATMLDLALANGPQRLLDLGCGRGEITIQAARQGCDVIAVDYSAEAIAIVRQALAQKPELEKKIDLRCADATQVVVQEPVDVAVAGDLIEHLATHELDQLYGTVARQLAPKGIFVIHTFPNLWYYQYDYPRRRRIARVLGGYLPPNPRSRFERLMHINEQSPRVLRRQLARYFPHVLLWFASSSDPAGSLVKVMRPRQLAAQSDLYAIASQYPIDVGKIREIFQSLSLSEADVGKVTLRSPVERLQIAQGTRGCIEITVANNSDHLLGNQKPHPVRFAYHWLEWKTRHVYLFEGRRSRLSPCSRPGTVQSYMPSFVAPKIPGEYLLQMTLVQEGVRWFDWTNPAAVAEVPVNVVSA